MATSRAPRPTVTHLEDRLVPAGTINAQIAVDQIGYRAVAPKVAVFALPVTGQYPGTPFTPGGTFQVRRVADDAVVHTGNLTAWNGGATHGQSGDRAWHADFSAVSTPGEYYVYDPTSDYRSFAFKVHDDAFNDTLKAAGRVFYYQRSGYEKLPQHAGNWAHPASHLQERTARRVINGVVQGPETARDVSGGWWDAGDYNKYVPFTTGPIWELLTAYEWNPAAFGDSWNLPGSGNNTPDLLDEVRWELDWLLRMQLADGSVLNRVVQASYNVGLPGQDTTPHYYTGPTTWATASAAASLAHAARVFQPFDSAYAATLRQAAEKAWAYLAANPTMGPSNGQDGGGNMPAAAGGMDAAGDFRLRVLAAAELWRATGGAGYKTFFEANYASPAGTDNGHHPLLGGWQHFDASLALDLNRAFVTYALTPGANATIVGQIRNSVRTMTDDVILPNYRASDPYLGYMWDGHYTWGSNTLKGNWGSLLTFAVKLNANPGRNAEYRAAAEEYLHYFHGRNPMSFTYLTNMGIKGANVGADRYSMEAYHSWWPDGNPLFDGMNSTYGPTPGYVVGGPNDFFNVSWVAPPYGQPAMKSYRDWNTGWNAQMQANENSWEVTEPAIYSQSSYLLLASQYAGPAAAPPVAPSGVTAQAMSSTQVAAGWVDNSPNETGFVIEWATNTAFTQNVGSKTVGSGVTMALVSGLSGGTTYYVRVRSLVGMAASAPSNLATVATPAGPVGAGNGLLATYWNNKDFTGTSVSRTDGTVDFNWGSGSPDPRIGRDTFSARWTGRVEAVESGTYTFRTYSDDGVRVWVNGKLVINNWTNHAPTYNTGQVALTAGQRYDIRVEYFENTGGAVMRLEWKRPGQAAFETVPQSRLYST